MNQFLNRTHSASRWPADPLRAIEVGQTDLIFVQALLRCGMDETECMWRLEQAALKAINRAAERERK